MSLAALCLRTNRGAHLSFRSALGLSAAGAAILATAPVYAQDTAAGASSDSGIADIVVTAQKREQNLQDVGIAITALMLDPEFLCQSDSP